MLRSLSPAARSIPRNRAGSLSTRGRLALSTKEDDMKSDIPDEFGNRMTLLILAMYLCVYLLLSFTL